MQSRHYNRFFDVTFWLALLGIYTIAFIVQYHTTLNHDVAWLAEASRRLLDGGSYTNDFFENNPPLILYLYIPPTLLSQHFSISVPHAITVCVFLLATVSLLFCYDLLKRIFTPPDDVLVRVLLLLITALFLVIPFNDFGQREHLFFIMSLPYFLLAAHQLAGNSVKSTNAIAIGLLAGIGFAIKPYFIFPLILVEMYYIYSRKNLFAWWRDDLLAIMLMMIAYLTAVFIFDPDYIFTVLPFAWHWCHFSDKLPYSILLVSKGVYFSLATIVFALIQFRFNAYKKLIIVLVLAMMGQLLAYLAQTTNYNYHLIPAFSTAVFLSAFLYGYQVLHGIAKKNWLLTVFLMSAVIAVLYFDSNVKVIFLGRPIVFLSFIAVIVAWTLFLMLSTRSPRDLLNISMKVFFIALCAYVCEEFMRHTDLIFYRFSLTLLLLVALVAVNADKINQRKWETIFYAVLGAVLFALPLSYVYTIFFTLKEIYPPALLAYMENNITNQPIYFISTRNEAYPYADYHSNVNAVSRFSSFWMLGSLVKEPLFVRHSDAKKRLAGKNFLAEMIAADLNSKKPVFVFVDVELKKHNFYTVHNVGWFKYERTVLNFNYLTYFSANKNFAQAWQPYHYVTTLYRDPMHPYTAVYQRQS